MHSAVEFKGGDFVQQLQNDGIFERFKNFSFPKVGATISVQAGRYMKSAHMVNGVYVSYPYMVCMQADSVPGPEDAVEFEVAIMQTRDDPTITDKFVQPVEAVKLWGLDRVLQEKLEAEYWDTEGIGCNISKDSVQCLLDSLLRKERLVELGME